MAEMLLLMMMVMVMVVVGRRSHVVDRHRDRRRVKRFGENSARNQGRTADRDTAYPARQEDVSPTPRRWVGTAGEKKRRSDREAVTYTTADRGAKYPHAR